MSDGEILRELEILLQHLGVELRLEEGRFEGGFCKIEKRPVFLLNRRLPVPDRLRVLCRYLASQDLSHLYILPAVRDLLESQHRAAGR